MKIWNVPTWVLAGLPVSLLKPKGIISKELTVGSKIVSTAFFVVDVKGRYNVLLGRDWIHVNGCVPSTLHQCVVQRIGDRVEVVKADEAACVAMAEPWVDVQGSRMECLTGRDLIDYDFVIVGKDGFMAISVKPTINMTQAEWWHVIDG
jgi:hypothetical protein